MITSQEVDRSEKLSGGHIIPKRDLGSAEDFSRVGLEVVEVRDDGGAHFDLNAGIFN